MKPKAAFATLAAIAVVIGLTVMSLGPASSQVADRRFTVTFPKSRPDSVIDAGQNGFGAGDMLLFRGKLTRSGNRVGRIYAKATILRRKRGVALVEASFWIEGQGKLSAQGKLVFNKREQGRIPITGGTGGYKRAGGTVRSVSGERVRLHFRVTIP